MYLFCHITKWQVSALFISQSRQPESVTADIEYRSQNFLYMAFVFRL